MSYLGLIAERIAPPEDHHTADDLLVPVMKDRSHLSDRQTPGLEEETVYHYPDNAGTSSVRSGNPAEGHTAKEKNSSHIAQHVLLSPGQQPAAQQSGLADLLLRRSEDQPSDNPGHIKDSHGSIKEFVLSPQPPDHSVYRQEKSKGEHTASSAGLNATLNELQPVPAIQGSEKRSAHEPMRNAPMMPNKEWLAPPVRPVSPAPETLVGHHNKLSIGKITVEIIPPVAKTRDRIIKHMVQQVPASRQGNMNRGSQQRFGLGQL